MSEVVTARVICREPYENCRVRISVLPIASLLFYVVSFWFCVTRLADLDAAQMGGTEGLPDAIREQIKTIYSIVAVLFMCHLLRLYLSILLLDESVEFFHDYFRRLAPWKRMVEFGLRLSMFCLTVWFVEHYFVSMKQPDVSSFSLWGIAIYFLLLVWDGTMAAFLKSLDRRRKLFLGNDFAGLLGFAVLFITTTPVVTENNVMYWQFAALLLALVSGVLLVVDFFIHGRKEYFPHFLSYVSYFAMDCVYHSGEERHNHYSVSEFLNLQSVLRCKELRVHSGGVSCQTFNSLRLTPLPLPACEATGSVVPQASQSPPVEHIEQ